LIQAFVSSTYSDLKDHRAYVIDRLARSGVFVDPMERWTAASDEPKALSQDRVKACDFCVLLVGFRRGHIPDGETRSITQLEYLEAERRGIDVLVFMASEEADWPVDAVAGLKNDPEMVRWRPTRGAQGRQLLHASTGIDRRGCGALPLADEAMDGAAET
jgi:hypothetical protein